MKTIRSRWQLAILALVATIPAWAQSNAPAVKSELTTMHATVQAVYPDKRSLTLVGPSGQPQTIFVGKDVNLAAIRAGDKVTVSYYQGFAAQIAKGATKLSDPAPAVFGYKSSNDLPGGGVGVSVTSTVKVLGVDPGTNTVSFKEADGSQHVITARSPNMQKFVHTLQVGDVVDITYTDSVAVSVTPSS